MITKEYSEKTWQKRFAILLVSNASCTTEFCYKSDFLRGMIKTYKIKETFNFIRRNRVKKMHPSPDLYIYAIPVYLEGWNIRMKTMLNIDIANKFVNNKKNR